MLKGKCDEDPHRQRQPLLHLVLLRFCKACGYKFQLPCRLACRHQDEDKLTFPVSICCIRHLNRCCGADPPGAHQHVSRPGQRLGIILPSTRAVSVQVAAELVQSNHSSKCVPRVVLPIVVQPCCHRLLICLEVFRNKLWALSPEERRQFRHALESQDMAQRLITVMAAWLSTPMHIPPCLAPISMAQLHANTWHIAARDMPRLT